MNNEKILAEVEERLNLLKMHPNVFDDYKKGVLNYTDINGGLYWLDKEKNHDVFDKIKMLKEDIGVEVYHAIRTLYKVDNDIMEMWSLLYVGDEEDWEQDKEAIKDNITYAYVYNSFDDYLSEFGSIGIRPILGGVMRAS